MHLTRIQLISISLPEPGVMYISHLKVALIHWVPTRHSEPRPMTFMSISEQGTLFHSRMPRPSISIPLPSCRTTQLSFTCFLKLEVTDRIGLLKACTTMTMELNWILMATAMPMLLAQKEMSSHPPSSSHSARLQVPLITAEEGIALQWMPMII